jgi:NTE family protein
MTQNKIGLVLAGGGAKGAYQVGALKYLSELGFDPTIIAGTSIGALNGGFLASTQPFSKAVTNLESIWKELGKKDIIKIDKVNLATIAFNTLLSFTGSKSIPKTLIPILKNIEKYFPIIGNEFYIFNMAPIEEVIRKNISHDNMKNGKELWVTAFPVLGITSYILSNLLVSKMINDVEYYHVNSLEEEKIYEILLASAAIPFAFPSRSHDGMTLVDGGLGDNVPLKALKENGCDKVIVIHLQTNSVWNRNDFSDMTIIEIRPEKDIQDIGWIKSLLDFSENRIHDLMERGYQDAKKQVESIKKVLQSVHELRQNVDVMLDLTEELKRPL